VHERFDLYMNPATSLPPLSLYLHFPWCVRKCPYCDFNSHTLRGELPEGPYVEALLQDLSLQSHFVQGRAIQSIFLGGGTPSLFSPMALATLLRGVRAQCVLVPDVEITLEANPGTIERGRFSDYAAAGITRVSLGAQSFSDPQLRTLGRIHASADTQQAVLDLRACGLSNFNLDLMYALPNQSVDEAVADIDTAVSLCPTHISQYQLTLEPGTVFAGRPPQGLPDLDLAADMQLACQERLARAGFAQYEVSAYASAERRCRHNLNYWQFGDYIGVGAGAHGKCSRLERGALIVERIQRPREPRRYLASVAAGAAGLERRQLDAADLPFEFLLNALRLKAGFERAQFEARTGQAMQTIVPALRFATARGLLETCTGGTDEHWRATSKGFSFLNDLQEIFLPAVSERVPPGARIRPTP
jgi:putative oxygen-independent coproporphyrinogen III oxidase